MLRPEYEHVELLIALQVSYLTRVSESVNDAQYRTALLEFKEFAMASYPKQQ